MAQQPDDSEGKSWERPWSTEEMRKNADNWNLAADAGLLKHLQQFSQVVLNHTHSTEKALDSLLETVNTTNTNINNVTNDFLCLANTQFLESRVYDDDDVESPQEVPPADTKQEVVDGDLMSKVRSALSVGVTVLDTMFEPADQNSGFESDFITGGRYRNPKNLYLSRPLPHLIGSAAFMADDNVGLVSSGKETEQPSAKAPTLDDLSMYSDESILTSSLKRNNMDDDSSNTSFCLGDDTPVQQKKPSRDAISITGPENDLLATPEEKSFADELAGKLAGMISRESKVPRPIQDEPSFESTVPQNRPSKKKGDMFGVPLSDDEDDALFSGRSGLFSGGRGLFDDVDDASKEKPINSSTPLPPPTAKPKIARDLFASNSADEDNDDLFAVPAKKESAKPLKTDAPPKPLSIGDVISQAVKRNVIAPIPTSAEINTPRKMDTAPSIPNAVPPPIPAEKKIPVGGRSMFGSAGLPIPKEALGRRPPSSSSEGSDDAGKNDKIVSDSDDVFAPSQADEDDLFQPTVSTINQNQNAQAPKPRVAKELIPESPGEDDLFATPSSFFSNSRNAEANKSQNTPKTNSSLGLFDAEGSSDEDNLFNPRPTAKQSLFNTIPPPLTKSEEKSKKVSLFDDSDSGDDEFLFSSASSAGSRRSQASADIFNSSSIPVPTDKRPLRKGLFDDDSVFSSQLDGPDIDIFRGVANSGGLGATVATASTSAAGNVTSANPAVATTKTGSSATTSAIDSSANSAVPTSTKTVISRVTNVAASTNCANPVVATTQSVGSGATTATTAVTAPSSKPNPIGGSLFDDDEDLFSVAKPVPPQKPISKEKPKSKVTPPPINKFITATTEDLFRGLENPTKDINSESDDLFGDLPEDDLFADNKIPARITPSMYDNNPKVPPDDLFGTDEDDGAIFIPRKPTLTISDTIIENVETVKEVIPVDISRPESIIDEKGSKPEIKPSPPKTLDIRNTTDPNVVGSFEDEDDGEDLFKPVDTQPPVTEKPAEKDLQQKSSQVDKPQIAEHLKSVSVPPEKPPKPVPTVRKSSVCPSEDEGAKTEIPRSPEVPPKPAARSSPKVEDKVPNEETTSVTQPPTIKARTPLAGLGLNINPLALLPGAQPPNKKASGEKPVGFDQPMENSSTLRFAQKDRVRGIKRRPPSRRARQEAAKTVDHTGIEITSPSSVLSPSTDEDDLFGVPQDLPPDSRPWPFDGAPILSPADPKIVPENVPVDHTTVDDPLLKMRAETSSGTDTDADVTEDHSTLFAFVKKKSKEPQREYLFSQTPTLPTKDDVVNVKNDLPDDEAEDDDLFKPSSAVKKIADLGNVAKSWKLSDDDDDDDDDLFTTGVSSSRSVIVNSTKELPKEVLKEKKPTLKSEPSVAIRNESSKDLFSQSPPKKTEKRLFDDDDDLDDDDLFSTASNKFPPPPVSKGSAPVQKKAPNSPQWKDDLFDDPLSGR